jgi:MFS family permease
LLQLTPANHTYALAVLSTLVAIATAILPPFAGALSDRLRRRGGDRPIDDRRVQTAIVLAIDALALLAMAYVSSVFEFGTATVAATVALMSASVVYQVLVPEIVPRRFWGTAAGYRGVMTLIGTIIGLLLGALLPPREALLASAGGVVASGLTLLFVPAAPPFVATVRREAPHIRDRYDLVVTLIARAWIVMGMTLLNTYVLYFFHDVLGVRNASLNTGLVAGAAMFGALASSVVVGVVSDKLDRRLVVCVSGLPMTLAALGFALAPDLRVIFVYSALFGLGYGGVFSVGWALALDSVPELGDVARDLGIWGTLSNLPMLIAPAIGAAIIAGGATVSEGYRWLFACAGGCFLLGSLTVLAARKPSAVPQ